MIVILTAVSALGGQQVEHDFIVVLGVVLHPKFNDVIDAIAVTRHALDRIGLKEYIEVVGVYRNALAGHYRLGGCCWLAGVGGGLGVRTPPDGRNVWRLFGEHT